MIQPGSALSINWTRREEPTSRSRRRTSLNDAKFIACARILALDRGCEPTGSHQKNLFSNSDANSLGRSFSRNAVILRNIAHNAPFRQVRHTFCYDIPSSYQRLRQVEPYYKTPIRVNRVRTLSAQRHGAHLHRRRTPFVAGMRNDCDLPRDQRAHRVVADPPVGGLPIGKRLPVRWAIGLDLSAIDVREQVGSFEVN